MLHIILNPAGMKWKLEVLEIDNNAMGGMFAQRLFN